MTAQDTDIDNVKEVHQLTSAILQDAALTTQLMRHANATHLAGQNVSTVDKALAILGIDNVKILIGSLASLDRTLVLADPIQVEQCQAEAVAANFCGLFAASITRQYAPRLKAQESQVCGLLQNIGRSFCWYYLYHDILHSHQLQADHNLSEDDAVQQTLGVRFDELGAAIARHWQFPDVLQKSLQSGVEKIPSRAAASSHEWHQHCAGFARSVTDALFRKPRHQTRGAIATAIQNYRTVLHLKDHEVNLLIEHTIAQCEASLLPDISAANFTNAGHILRRSSERVTDWLSSQDSLTKTVDKNSQKTKVDVIYQILRNIHDEFHFDMTLLCIPNGFNELVAVAGVGRNANQIMSRFRCNGLRDDIFRLVAAKTIGLYVSDVEHGPYSRFTPSWYMPLVGARSLYLMSLMKNGEPLGILYGDFTLQKNAGPAGLDGKKMRQWRNDLINVLQNTKQKL
jgi:HD-like signal output (HDOD) protein